MTAASNARTPMRFDAAQVITTVGCLLVFGVTFLLAPSLFTARSLQNMLVQLGPIGLVAIGQCFVILVGGLDLSVAAVMATAAVLSASFGPDPSAFPLVLASVLAMSVAVGFVNGTLVTRRKLEPFLVTLATMVMVQGLRSAWTEGAPLGDTPQIIRFIGRGDIYGLPFNTIVLLFVVLVMGWMLRRTVLGRRIYIVGSSERAAFLTGIDTDGVRLVCYIICSVMAGLAGMVLAGYLDQVDNWIGKGYELDSIVAAVMGGVALSGGKGTVVGAVMGSAILVLLSNVILHLGIPIEFQLIMKGAVVVAAIALYSRRTQAQ